MLTGSETQTVAHRSFGHTMQDSEAMVSIAPAPVAEEGRTGSGLQQIQSVSGSRQEVVSATAIGGGQDSQQPAHRPRFLAQLSRASATGIPRSFTVCTFQSVYGVAVRCCCSSVVLLTIRSWFKGRNIITSSLASVAKMFRAGYVPQQNHQYRQLSHQLQLERRGRETLTRVMLQLAANFRSQRCRSR